MNQSIEVFRLLYRPWSYIAITLGNALFSAGIVIILAVILGQGIISFFIGSLAGGICFAIIGWRGIREYLDFSKWHRCWWPRLLRFGLPLMPAGLVIWVVNTADRWFISHHFSMEAVGIYAVGAKFAILLATATTIFRTAWWPIALDAMHSEDGPSFYRIMARLYMGVWLAGVVFLTALSPWLLKLLTAPQFHSAYPVVGLLSFSAVFYGFFLISGAGTWKAEKTWWVTVALSFAALANIALNAVLVPVYGGIGAAVATSLAMLMANIILLFVGEKYWLVKFPVYIMSLQIIISAVSVWVILELYSWQPLWLIFAVTVLSMLILFFLAIGNDGTRFIYKLLKNLQKG